jgi:dTDP-4-amino-4,6-dideoxygalactose transaminase
MLQPAYAHYANNVSSVDEFKKNFPNATKATTDTFFLGTSPVIKTEQLDYIQEKVDEFMKQYVNVQS